VKAVAEKFSLQPSQLKLKTNEQKIAYPRQIAMYLAKELTPASLPEIGKAFQRQASHHRAAFGAEDRQAAAAQTQI
jgi:chromosomal replication initiation ATPase DnaA